jgi:hypothetical protein
MLKSQMRCNSPVKSWRPGKKFAVKACANGNEKLLHYGAVGFQDFTQHHDKKRRASFRARHKCDTNPPNKLTPRYWACEDLW